jgi:SAM-dependent methyltransferase
MSTQTEEQHWSGPGGHRWHQCALLFEKTFQPVGEQLLKRAALSAGQHVVEIGCGAGGLSLDIASRVAPDGSVTALDISCELCDEGARRAKSANANAVTFVAGDAAKTKLPRKYDRLISRFGSMFFTEPYPAFAHLHSHLAPSATIALACWAPLKDNVWMLELRHVLARYFDVPEIPPKLPGPFAFDNPDYQRDILEFAGFKKIDIELWQSTMPLGGAGSTPESAADFMMHGMGVAQRAMDAPEPVRKKVFADLCNQFKPYLTPTGIQTPMSVFFTTAQV